MAEMTYQEWESKLNNLILRNYGVSLHDLPDCMTRDAYEDGISPEDFMEDMDIEEMMYS